MPTILPRQWFSINCLMVPLSDERIGKEKGGVNSIRHAIESVQSVDQRAHLNRKFQFGSEPRHIVEGV